MTEKLYWQDMYLRSFDAKVTNVSGNEITLDRTAFYPAGGGQPKDTGTITVKSRSYNIIDLKKNGEDIVHVSDTPIDASPGDTVHGEINWDLRYAYIRHHTAIHLIDAIVETEPKPGIFTGGMMYENKAHFDLDMEGLNREKAQELIDKANKAGLEGHDVVAKFISREDALKIPSLSRTKPGAELIAKLDTIRVVEIVGLDTQADGGLHVRNTREIGTIRLNKFDNKGTHRKRVEITLENPQQ